MKNKWTNALGDLDTFVSQIPNLTDQFLIRIKAKENSIKQIREYANDGEGATTDDPQILREMMAAFGAYVNAHYGYQIKATWWFGKKLIAANGQDRCDFFDFFYRTIFEGVDMAPDDEGLATPG